MKWIKRIFLLILMLNLSGCVIDNTPSVDQPTPSDTPKDNDDPIIEEVDTESPVITITGESEIIIILGTSYNEDDVVVTDNIDTDLVPIRSGELDINMLGTYTVSYNVSDTAGNEAEPVSRKIHVVNKNPGIQVSFGYESYDFAGFSVNTYDPNNLYYELTAYLYDGVDLIDSILIPQIPYSGEFHNLEMNVDYDLYIVVNIIQVVN